MRDALLLKDAGNRLAGPRSGGVDLAFWQSRFRRRAKRSDRSSIALLAYGDLGEVAHVWRDFETRADCTVFQTFGRLAAWQRHIGTRIGSRPAIVLGRDADGELLFIFPLAVTTRGGARRLTWLGSDLSDYNAPMLSPCFPERVDAARFGELWRETLALLRAERRTRFDLIDLTKMPGTLGRQQNPFAGLPVSLNPSGAYVAGLSDDWENFYAARRSASTRKTERRKLRQLAEHGAVRFVDAGDAHDIERTLDTLLSQKGRTLARIGAENIFARPGYRDFLLDLATNPATSDIAHVSRLEVGVTTAAASLGLRFRSRYSLVLSSYQEGELARFGPGRAHLHELMRSAIDRGFREFDFTIGDEPYKRDWTDDEVRLYDYLAATSVRGLPAVAAAAALRRAKRFIKARPDLWHAATRGRAFLGLARSQKTDAPHDE